MARTSIVLFIVLNVFATSTLSLNILALFPHPGKSHFNVFEPLLQELARKGHTLTVVSPFPQKTAIPGYKDISIKSESKLIVNYFNMDLFKKSIWQFYVSPIIIANIASDICSTLKSKTMQDFRQSDEKFDLIITEIFNNDCYLGFVHKYKVPFIGLSSTMIMPYSNGIVGNPVNPSFIPIPFLPFSDKMSFVQRLENTVNYVYTELMYKFLVENPSHEEAKKYFGNEVPTPKEIGSNISLILVNSHFTLNLARPLVPNVIEVGGLFIAKPKKLPQNLEKFITESKHGVIYFSMGSMIKGHTFPEEKKQAFLKVFSKLKQRVVWKWENTTMPDKIDNVMIQPWMPQLDILCHPNVVAFICHGGLLGTTEAVHCGVPMVVMPQYGDQFTNAKAVEVNGAGVTLDLAEATEATISQALNTILHPSFNKRAKKFSEIYRDRQQSPLESAIYWVEYVARHNGAPHMRSASVDLPIYQYLLLDVIAFILTLMTLIITIIYCILRFILNLLFKKKTSINKSKKIKTK